MKAKIFLIACLLMPLHLSAACLDATTDDVDDYLYKKLEARGFTDDSIPAILPIGFSLLVDGQIPTSLTPAVKVKKGKKKPAEASFTSSFRAEAFVKMEPGTYQVIPGIGLSLKISESSLFYVCLEKKGQRKSNFVRIIHLRKDWNRGKRFQVEIIPANWNLADKGAVGEKIFGSFINKLNVDKKIKFVGPAKVIDGLNEAFHHFIFRAGVVQIEVRPTEIEATAASKLFNTIKTSENTLTLPHDSKWLVAP